MIYLLPSADYEFYLGRNLLTEEQVLIEPTWQLLDLFESLGLKTTLFCDVASLWRYREWGQERIASLMEQQMTAAVSRGHDVQAHLHPHWLRTEWGDNGYVFKANDFLLGSLMEDEEECRLYVKHLLDRTVSYLHQLLQPVDPEYRCIAFRAGGYGLQPREHMILACLIEAGFSIDSSIIPGYHQRSATHRVDFSRVPKAANYWLDPQGGIDHPAPAGQGIFEIPVASYHLTPMQSWLVNFPEALRQGLAILAGGKTAEKPRGEPCGVVVRDLAPSRWPRLRQAYWRMLAAMNTRFLRLEAGPNLAALQATLNGYLNSLPGAEVTVYLSLNCHPKGMTRRHFMVLKRFLHSLARCHGPSLQCITFQEAGRHVAVKKKWGPSRISFDA
ncbi:MAG: hypothetical protein HQL73_02345 [Magnetococcales bacterium]|nr:hypothetical protein [Magnetococcales bacterium]